MSKVYLRKRQVATRYGGVTPRSIERAVEDGRIPAPIYPIGANTPLWDLETLEAAERAAVLRKDTSYTSWCGQLVSRIATATRDEAATILSEHKDLIDALSDSAREKLLAELQDIIAQIPDTAS